MINASTMQGGTINGTYINTEKDVNVGDQVNLGNVTSKGTDKSLNFYNNGSDYSRLGLRSDGTLELMNKENNPYKNCDINIENLYNSIDMTNDLNISGTRFVTIQSGSSTLLKGDVCIGDSYGGVGFYGSSPISKQSATRLPSTATLTEVITKVNGILGKLENLGLLDING